MITFNDLKPDNHLMQQLSQAYLETMNSGCYIGGESVESFEKQFARYLRVKHCIAVGSGYDALYIALKACGIGHGKKVAVPTNTCIPTWSAIYNSGANIVPIDWFENYVITSDIPRYVDAVIPVHLYGIPVKLDHINEMKSFAIVIEDACQAHGSMSYQEYAGTMGHMGCFSFYPTKNLGCFGDGGAIVTNRDDLAQKARMLRRYGTPGAINSCLDPLQAEFLKIKLRYLESINDIRRRNASLYAKYLSENEHIILPCDRPDDHATYNYHQFVIQLSKRDYLKSYLHARRIQTMIHYKDIPGDMFNVYDPHISTKEQSKQARRLSNSVLSLPIANVNDKEIEMVSIRINQYFSK